MTYCKGEGTVSRDCIMFHTASSVELSLHFLTTGSPAHCPHHDPLEVSRVWMSLLIGVTPVFFSQIARKQRK